MSQIIITAFSVTVISLKTGDISFSIVFSVLKYGITCRFHGILEMLWSPSCWPNGPLWDLASQRLSSFAACASGSKEMDGFLKASDQLSGDGRLASFMKSPCLSIG
jgi:hypothetical protein